MKIANFIKIFIITIFCVCTLSCIEKTEKQEADLGKEATKEEYEKALQDSAPNTSIFDAKVNQYVVYEDNARVEQGNIMRTRLIKHKLTEIKPEAFILFQDWWKFNLNTGDIIDEKHGDLVLPVGTASPLQAFMTASADDCDGETTTDKTGLTYDCIKFFNLVSKRLRVKPPELVRNKTNCMGLRDCLMDVNYLKYDEVKWIKGKSVGTITITAEIALDVPDLMYEILDNGAIFSTPPVLSLCYKGKQSIEGHLYTVKQCSLLRDFE